MSGLRSRVFPGSSAVWIGGLVLIVLGAVLMGRMLFAKTASTTGTNSVDIAAVVAHAEPGQETCIKDLVIPKETGRVEVWLGLVGVQAGGKLEAWVGNLGTPRIPLRYVGAGGNGDFKPFALSRPLLRDLENAKVCIVAHREAVNYGGSSVMRLPGAAVSSIGKTPLQGVDIGVRFLRPLGDSPRVIDALGAALSRATLFDPGIARVAIYVVGLLLLLVIYPIVRVAATVERYTVRRLAVGAALLAFVHACCWALLLQPFHGADESEHFAYAQHLAATGKRPDSSQTSKRPPYASSELRLMEAVHHNSTILNPSSRMRWDEFYEEKYDDSLLANPSDSDGGGYTESATGHSPLYYGVVGLPYRLMGRPDDLPSALLAMRLFNALLAAAIAALAVLTAAHLLPRRKQAAWFAGVLVAMQPVFASVSAAVNNDTAVNLLAAILVFLLVRAWRTGFVLRDALLVGVVAILLPVAKITGFALVPVVGLAAIALVVQHGWTVAARWMGAAAAGAAVTLLLWVFALSPLMGGGRGGLVNVHPVAGPAAANTTMVAATTPVAPAPPPASLSVSPVGRAEYFVQTFIPQAPLGPKRWQIAGTTELMRWPAFVIYIQRGYGLFGWKSMSLSYDLQRLILLALSIGWVLALVAAVRARAHWRSWVGAAVIMGGAVLSVLAFISYAYATSQIHTEPGEQGRYAFTAIVPLAVLMSGAVVALRGRLGQLVLGGGVTAAWVLALLACTSALRGWFM